MESPFSDHSDSDSGESWTLLENDTAHNADPLSLETKNTDKSVIEDTCEKDEDTDGISIISDSEPESPFQMESSITIHPSTENQLIREEIPVYSSQDIDLETNVSCQDNNDTKPLVEENITGDEMQHKIYVHRRNNRLSTVLNIIMLVSVMTAAGVAIGHMWGVRHDCPSHTTPSFNKILSDLYKLQAENANYKNKLRELSLIIEDYLHYECEREADLSLSKQQTVDCRQQKIYNIQKYLKGNAEEGKRNKRSVNSKSQKVDENKLNKPNHNQLTMPLQNISKIKPIKKENKDKIISIPEIIITDESLPEEKYEGAIPLINEDNTWKETKITYADSLKSNNINININEYENVYKNNKIKFKMNKKVKVSRDETLETSSEEEIIKDRHSVLKHKLKQKMQNHEKPLKNNKRKNKHEYWDLKEGVLKYYDDVLSNKNLKSEDNTKNKINKIKPQIINDSKLHIYDDYFKQEGAGKKHSNNLNWYDNRAQLRKEARKRQQLDLLNISNTGDWYFKRMYQREECRDKENSTCKRNLNKKKNFKTKPYK